MSKNQYTIALPAYNGPLDLLLHLIERQELDITAIALARVTEQYLAQVEELKRNRVDELIDFLVIAARLILIKSRALLPQDPDLPGGDGEEEDPAEALVRQLRQYKRFKQVAAWLHAREEQGLRTYLRVAPPPKLDSHLDLTGVTVETLITAVRAALERSENRDESVAIVQPRRITIEGQIRRLRFRTRGQKRIQFEELLSEERTGVEVAITLLAVLEMIKRREIRASQDELFGPISIEGLKDVTDEEAEQDLGELAFD